MRFTFKKLALLGAHVARGVAKLADLSSARLDFVTLLMHGPLCQRDLAARLCVTEPVISRMVRGLMKQGFVKREIPVADRRFRLVSLTQHGRDEYLALTRTEWLMDPSARFDAQGFGESCWQQDWRRPLARLELGWLAKLSESDAHDDPVPEPPYDGIRARTLSGVYDVGHDLPIPLAETWPWNVRVLAPPLERGLENDPLSDEYADAWLLARDRRRHGPVAPPRPRKRPGPKPRALRPFG